MVSESQRKQHAALCSEIGFAEISAERSQVEIVGKDRAQLLHGLCTNNIKALKSGEGCEAFLTNVQGRTIGYVYVFCGAESLQLDSVAGENASLIRNLDRFVIREDVRFVDQTEQWREFLVGGGRASTFLRELFSNDPPSQLLGHAEFAWLDGRVHVRRVPFAGPDCFFLSADVSAADSLRAKLMDSDAVLCDPATIETVRIEAGSPLFGRDITEENLPQEVDRNAQAISFTKGCYLGQETVARLDALGHVNRTLCGVKFAQDAIPPPGSEIKAGERVLGRITSSCWSVRLDAPLALAYLRRGHNQVGNRFESPWGEAEVVRLPVL